MQHAVYIRAVLKIRPQIVQEAIRIVTVEDDAEDIVQEALLKLWVLRDRFETEDEMRKIASVITRNLCLNHKRLKRETMNIEFAKGIAHSSTPESERIDKENNNLLVQAVNGISDRYRAILNMRNVEGLSYPEIASLLGTTESSVRGIISRARMELMKNLKRLG